MLFSHLRMGLPGGLFQISRPKPWHAHLLSPIPVTCNASLFILDWVTRIIFGEEYGS